MPIPGFLRSRAFHSALVLGLLTWVAFKLHACAQAIGTAHLDFAVFWEAAHRWAEGAPLYPPLVPSEHPPLLWLYPATAIYSVFWAAYFSLADAILIWFIMKCFVVAAATIGLVQRFRSSFSPAWALAVIFLSWGRPIFSDLWNGNFVVFEWALLLAGTMFWIRGRIPLALTALGLGAGFKMLPIGYAFGWFVADQNKSRRSIANYGIFLSVALAALYFSFGDEIRAYVALFREIPQMDVLAWKNHDFSHQSFPYFFFRLTHDLLGLETQAWRTLGWLGSMSVVSVLIYYRHALRRAPREWQAAVLWVAFSLALPRNKDYNLIVLVWPSLLWLEYAAREIERKSAHRRDAWIGIALILLSCWGGQNRDAQTVATFLFSQKRFLLELGFAALLLRAALRQARE